MSILKDIFSVNRKTFLNPTAWVGVTSIGDQNRTIVTILKALFSKPTPQREETFEEAMTRWNLAEEELATGIKRYRLYAFLFLACSIAGLLYGFYLLFRYYTFSGWLLAIAMAALFLSQAYQYDFWAYQMRERSLGLSMDSYLKHLLGDKDKQ